VDYKCEQRERVNSVHLLLSWKHIFITQLAITVLFADSRS